jgi:hypothetical protein
MASTIDLVPLGGVKACTPCYNPATNAWVTGDDGGSLRRLSPTDGMTTHEFTHDDAVDAVAVSADGTEVAVCVGGRAVHVHADLDSHDQPPKVLTTVLQVTHAAFLNDMNTLLVASKESNIVTYNCVTGQPEATLTLPANTGVRSFAATEDDKFLCITDLTGGVHIHALSLAGKGATATVTGSDKEHSVDDVASMATVRDENAGFQASWLPAHSHAIAVAVPGKKGCVSVFYRSGGVAAHRADPTEYAWQEVYLAPDQASHLSHGDRDVNLAAFSPNGR